MGIDPLSDEKIIESWRTNAATLESWVRLFDRHGLQLREVREPEHPGTGKPA
jgi:hypothetical protein